MSEDYRFIGKPTRRKDASQIVTGATQYLNDIRFADLLYGKVLRSPHPHALITRIEAEFPGRLLMSRDDLGRWRDDDPHAQEGSGGCR